MGFSVPEFPVGFQAELTHVLPAEPTPSLLDLLMFVLGVLGGGVRGPSVGSWPPALPCRGVSAGIERCVAAGGAAPGKVPRPHPGRRPW